MNLYLVLILLAFPMSWRGVDDVPVTRSFAEYKAAVRNTGWVRGMVLTVWFLITFALHFAEGFGWTVLAICNLMVRALRWANDGLANLGNTHALATSPG